MAKKPARKQAPPRMQGRSSKTQAEASVDDLVAELGEADEADPESEGDEAEPESEGGQGAEAPATEGGAQAPAKDDEAVEAVDAGADEGGEAAEVPAEESAEDKLVKLVESLPIDPEDDLSEVEGEASPRMASIVESLLFASTKPLRVKQIRKVLGEPTVRQIQLALKHLIELSPARGIVVAQVAGGFVLQTNPQNAQWVQRLLQAKPVRLSRPQLETLAIVAYRQPVTRPEIDHVRGVDSGAVLKILLERELIQIVGKKDEPGRPMLYGTTVNFLEFFNLMSLRDLPDLREFRELSDDTKATLRRKMPGEDVEALGQEVLDFARVEGEGEEEGESAESAEESELSDEADGSEHAEDSEEDSEDSAEDSEDSEEDAEDSAEDSEDSEEDSEDLEEDAEDSAEDAEDSEEDSEDSEEDSEDSEEDSEDSAEDSEDEEADSEEESD